MHLSVHNGRYTLHVHVCWHVVLLWDVHERILIKSKVDNGPIQLQWVMEARVARSERWCMHNCQPRMELLLLLLLM